MCSFRSLAGLLSVIVLWLSLSVGSGIAHGKPPESHARTKAGLCTGVAGSVNYQGSGILVTVCPSTVATGQYLHFDVRTLHGAAVRVALQYPDGNTATAVSMADKQGLATFTVAVRYNPINRYAKAQFTVTAYRQNKTDAVVGSVNIAQATPVGSVHLLARPASKPVWCPTNAVSCMIQNNSTLVILVETVANAQVSVSLAYPDGQSIQCPRNDLTHNVFSSTTGAFQCELPVVYNGKVRARGAKLLVMAQVSADGFTGSRTLSLGFSAA